MEELDDIELLRRYVERDSQEDFAALVTRHLNKVYSVALRHTGNPHSAEEIAQAVFVILAKKAPRLLRHKFFSGWLYQTARLTSVTFIRSEIRRARREQEAHMQSALNEKEDALWPQIAPLLDAALAELNQADRHAIVLRFFDCRGMKEIAAALGASEEAAKKRVNRALEKLQRYFLKRGVVSTTSILAGAISANSIQAAPVSLAKSVTVAAISKGAAASGSTLALIKGALKVMAWTKAKTAVVAGMVVLLAAGTATVTINRIRTVESANDESWRTMNLNARLLEQAPPQVHILPTKFQGDLGREVRLGGRGANRKVAGVCVTVPQLISAAYYGAGDPVTAGAPSRTVFNVKAPATRYDFICSLSKNQGAALQQELKQQVGLSGRRETRQMNVYLLRIHHSGAPGLEPNPNAASSRGTETKEGLSFVAGRLSALAGIIENILRVPVIDRTGATQTFNITLKLNGQGRNPNVLKQALLDQLGLELVSDRVPVEVLVVDKAD